MDFKQFAKLMEQRADNIIENTNELKKEVSTQLVTALAEFTPMDTGKASSNWLVGVNSPRTEQIEAHSPGTSRSTRPQNIRATIDSAKVILDTVAPGDQVHVSNNTDYIKDLERGTSGQAPTGMVKQSIDRARSVIKGRKLLGKRNGRPN